MKKNMKKIVLWLFVITIISFSASIMLYKGDGITFADLIDSNSSISLNMNNKDFDLDSFINMQKDRESNANFKKIINEERIFEMNNIDSINVNTVSSDIKFISEDRDDIKIQFQGDIASSNEIFLPEFITENKNNTLSIEIKHKSIMNVGFYSSTIRVYVYIPKKYSNNLVVSTVSGNIDLGYINDMKNVYLKSVSGDIKAESLYSKKTILKSTSGSLKIEDFTGELNCSTTSGDLFIDVNKLKYNISCKSVSGDIKIQLPDNTEFYLESKSTSGDIDCEFPISIEGKLSDNIINGKIGNGNYKISTITVSGDTKISH